jgi:hypothetical protein
MSSGSGFALAFPLYFATAATRHPWQSTAMVFCRRKHTTLPDQAGGVFCGAK